MHPNQVPAIHRRRESSRIKGHLHGLAILMIHNALNRYIRLCCNLRRSPRILNQLSQRLPFAQFINGWLPYASGDGSLGSYRRNKNYVAGKQMHVFRPITAEQ